VNLRGADLRYATLTGADLRGADLHGAIANRYASFLPGFDWGGAGVMMT
jgi:uncharacterized protein YjbI with pentapeptide repeats